MKGKKMKINFSIKGCEIWLKEAEGEEKLTAVRLNWQETRLLSELLLALIETADKRNITNGTLEK